MNALKIEREGEVVKLGGWTFLNPCVFDMAKSLNDRCWQAGQKGQIRRGCFSKLGFHILFHYRQSVQHMQ
jgi:hypothetical protein